MRIVIYDEDKYCKLTKEVLEAITTKHGIDIEVECFSRPELCYAYLLQNGTDLLIAEIIMPVEKGTDLTKRLRKKLGNSFAIIFLTVSNDYAVESYDVNACNYLLKPCSNDKFEQALFRCGLFDKENYIYLADGKNSIKFDLREIIAVEAFGKRCLVYTVKQQYEIHNQISKIAAVLPSSYFWQVHRSYLINISHIDSLQGYDFVMDNNLIVPIRRSKFSEIKKAYMNLQ